MKAEYVAVRGIELIGASVGVRHEVETACALGSLILAVLPFFFWFSFLSIFYVYSVFVVDFLWI